MKVTIETTEGKQVTLSVKGGFTLLVDNEVILEHTGTNSPYSVGSDSSSLFNGPQAYIQCKVPSSSFIESWQWWDEESAIGEGALEIYFKNGDFISYCGVPEEVAVAFKNAIFRGESAGKFYNAHIRNVYEIYSQGEDA